MPYYRIRLGAVAAWFAASGCGQLQLPQSGDFVYDPAAGSLPVLASAGADAEVLRGFTTRLESSGTFSPSGRPFTLRWEQIAGEPVHLSQDVAPSPTFIAPLGEQTLTFELTADDGVWVTRDQVDLLVRRIPERVSPRLDAGPDRFLFDGETGPANDTDVVSQPAPDVEALWETVEAEPSAQLGGEEAEPIGATIARLVGIRDGMRSAPDYLVLHPTDADPGGAQAPVVNVTAPSVVAPGESVTLDALGSTDPNGDDVRFRWEQVQGPVPVETYLGGTFDLTAPSQPQALLFRVFATDGLLESSPAGASVVITPRNVATPAVAPQEDARTHPGNEFILDADGIPSPEEDASITFEWQQTVGEPVELHTDGSGRFAGFQAPGTVGELAFAVVAELPDEPGPVRSPPEVARVTVVEESDNFAPNVFLCVASTNTTDGVRMVITAEVSDPEADPLNEVTWAVGTDPLLSLELNERLAADIVANPLCPVGRDLGSSGLADTATVYQADFLAPPTAAVITVELSACDDLGACGQDSTDITIE